VCDIVVKKFTFAISSPDEFLYVMHHRSLQVYMHYSLKGLYILLKVFDSVKYKILYKQKYFKYKILL